jgi:hypothetical protein
VVEEGGEVPKTLVEHELIGAGVDQLGGIEISVCI